MRHGLLFLALLLPIATWADERCSWSHWASFKAAYIESGRVIDRSDPRQITTSEGQSYGMFFALVANDRASFDQLLHWTQGELAAGDLGAYLPAWLWGRIEHPVPGSAKTSFGVLDNNSAADSDLWIAYTLIEAGRLWQHYYYTSLGYLLLEQIRRYEVVDIPNLGLSVLPAPKGFADGSGSFRLNPSYAPLQILDRFASLYPARDWQAISASTRRLIIQTMPKGYSPDWVKISPPYKTSNWVLDLGSYDAIRSYLWAGMLADSHPHKVELMTVMKPMAQAVKENGAPPEKINVSTGLYSGTGSAGFSAALLPFLAQYDLPEVLGQQRQRAAAVWEPAIDKSRYYATVLALFGTGWDQGYFRFSSDGALIPAWQSRCES